MTPKIQDGEGIRWVGVWPGVLRFSEIIMPSLAFPRVSPLGRVWHYFGPEKIIGPEKKFVPKKTLVTNKMLVPN